MSLGLTAQDKPSPMCIKRSITLIEMMIVISLIATALGGMALPLSKALKGEKFERGVDRVIGKIMLAQELMLDFHTDVQLILEQDKEGEAIHCLILVAIPLPPQIEKGINHRPHIAGIRQMAFNHEDKDRMELSFDGSFGVLPQGTLTLMGPRNAEHIALPGYPGQIRRGNHVQTTINTPYPEEILSAL